MSQLPPSAGDPSDTREAFMEMTGQLLFVTQDFEKLLADSLKLVFSDLDEFNADNFFKKDKRSLGRVLKDFRSRVAIDSDIDVWLGKLVEERNFFVHHLSHEEGFDTETHEGRKEAWEFYARYFGRLEQATLLFSAIIYQKGKDADLVIPDEEKYSDFIETLQQYMPEIAKLKKR